MSATALISRQKWRRGSMGISFGPRRALIAACPRQAQCLLVPGRNVARRTAPTCGLVHTTDHLVNSASCDSKLAFQPSPGPGPGPGEPAALESQRSALPFPGLARVHCAADGCD